MYPAATTPSAAIGFTSTTTTTTPYSNQPTQVAAAAAVPCSDTTTNPSTPRDAPEITATAPAPQHHYQPPRITGIKHSPRHGSSDPAATAISGRPRDRHSVLFAAAFFLPPLAVYLRRGIGKAFQRNVAFTILGWYVLDLQQLHPASRGMNVIIHVLPVRAIIKPSPSGWMDETKTGRV
ncbi:hypothetical protein N658DRAFT_225234 [Parathielavia hyrcaniae]|uniref:Uncharacterized protein n=1 Tax=Parathielavia hyrcaniae TaxID=113614 RepID=A0AAN6PUS8_9PEZI|nr:hypothetical protein N658DRAFT_225234 [Parathielavia hyrcaniae]